MTTAILTFAAPPEHVTFAAPGATVDREKRIITGKIAAYGVTTDDGRRIQFDNDALKMPADLQRVKLLFDHDMRRPVGFMSTFDAATLDASFRVPEGAEGDQALADAANGLRDGFSVGVAFANDADYTFQDDKTIIHSARVLEVSLVAVPAFGDARVTDVAASASNTNPEGNPMDLEALKAALAGEFDAQTETIKADLGREFKVELDSFKAGFTPASNGLEAGLEFNSLGEWIKELAAGDDNAKAFYEAARDSGASLAYEGGKIADSNPQSTWITDIIRLVSERRRVTNFFNNETLPAKGMVLEYAVLAEDNTVIEEQENEGDTLAGPGEIKLTSKTTEIHTRGGYAKVTRQIIDRADPAYLSTLFRAQQLRYARATEADARTALNAALATAKAASQLDLGALATTKAADWLDLLVDAAILYEETDYALDALIVSTDVFKYLQNLETTGGARLMAVHGENANMVGSARPTALEGNLAGVTVKGFPKLAAGSASFANPLALTTWESAGAPFQLQDDNVTELTRDYALYGYFASASQHPQALQAITFGA